MKLTSIFNKPKFLALFIGLGIFLTIIYFVVSGIYVASLAQFNETAEPLRIVLTLAISWLSSLAITLMIYKEQQPLVCKQNYPAFLGSFVGLFTTACPVCFPLMLSVLGIGGATALAVSSNAMLIQLASIGLILASIHLVIKD